MYARSSKYVVDWFVYLFNFSFIQQSLKITTQRLCIVIIKIIIV